MLQKWFYLFMFFLISFRVTLGQEKSLHRFDPNQETRWSSPENRHGIKGSGGLENQGAKGHPSDPIEPGHTDTLLDIQGTGIINRIWITVIDRSPQMLRSLRIEMYWDNESKPAVSVPFGDFFGVGLGRTTQFENVLFASPEGRSFECFIPMPFRKAAKIVVINESSKVLTHLFYDVDYNLLKNWDEQNLYFHAYWHRDTATTLGQDFELLPKVMGKGRFLGTSVGINANFAYGNTWWGEGEVKAYLDGDNKQPTLVGTGTEDYIGTGWGQGIFINKYSGCLIANDSLKQWSYYRYHIPDPIFFSREFRITIQQIGGGAKNDLAVIEKKGAAMIPVTTDKLGHVIPLYDKSNPRSIESIDGMWINYYRSDDVSAVAYFYLDKPSSNLPPLQPVSVRTYNLR